MIEKSELFMTLDESVKEENCKGRVYKAEVSHCRTKRGFMFMVRMNEVKSLSCPGCEFCGWIDDNLSELTVDGFGVTNIANVEHGGLYTIGMTNISTDWETGIVDNWDLKLNEFIPNEPDCRECEWFDVDRCWREYEGGMMGKFRGTTIKRARQDNSLCGWKGKYFRKKEG